MAARKQTRTTQPSTPSTPPVEQQAASPPETSPNELPDVPPAAVSALPTPPDEPELPETEAIPERPPGWDQPVTVKDLNIFPEPERIPARIVVDAFPQQRVTVRWHDPQTNDVVRETEVDPNTAPMGADEYALLAISMLPEATHREFYETLIHQHGYSPSRVLLASLVNQARMDGGGMNIAAVESHAQDMEMHGHRMPHQQGPFPGRPGASFYQQPAQGMSECQYCFEHFQPRKFGQETCDSTCGLLKQGRQPYPALAQPKMELRNQRLMQMGKAPDAGVQPQAAGYPPQMTDPQQPIGYQDETVQSQAGSYKNTNPVVQPQYHADQSRVVDPSRQFRADARFNAAPAGGAPVIDGPGLPPAEMMVGH